MKDLEGYTIGATDGVIGHVKDFYFDDEAWVIRGGSVGVSTSLGRLLFGGRRTALRESLSLARDSDAGRLLCKAKNQLDGGLHPCDNAPTLCAC
jgi:hypothetical protein